MYESVAAVTTGGVLSLPLFLMKNCVFLKDFLARNTYTFVRYGSYVCDEN